MGGLKKLFGGSSTPQIQQVAPSVQAVQSADSNADVENSNTTKKKRAGFASTQSDSILTSNNSANRETLG